MRLPRTKQKEFSSRLPAILSKSSDHAATNHPKTLAPNGSDRWRRCGPWRMDEAVAAVAGDGG
jgi:hypothetical protein